MIDRLSERSSGMREIVHGASFKTINPTVSHGFRFADVRSNARAVITDIFPIRDPEIGVASFRVGLSPRETSPQ